MVYSVNTNKNPVVVKLNVQSNFGKRKLIIAGFDADVKNTKYFFREMIIDGNKDFSFNMPLSPDKLNFVIYDFEENKPYRKSNLFTINNLKVEPLILRHSSYNSNLQKFVDFSKTFCLQAGFLNEGSYSDKDKIFEIRYFSEIKDKETGQVIKTPARIHKTDNYIEVSQAYFHKLTVPSRFMILAHEYAHNFLNREKNSEIEADINGLKLYLDCQYPVIESVYAFTQIFTDNSQSKERLDTIMAFLRNYENSYFDKKEYQDTYNDVINK